MRNEPSLSVLRRGWSFAKASRLDLERCTQQMLPIVSEALDKHIADATVRERILTDLAERFEAEVERSRPRGQSDSERGKR